MRTNRRRPARPWLQKRSAWQRACRTLSNDVELQTLLFFAVCAALAALSLIAQQVAR